MATKPSDSERKDETKSEPEVTTTDPTENSTTDIEDSDESSVEEEDKHSDWDKDSFDGREYHSSDSENEGLDTLSRSHRRLVIESKGFFDSSLGAAPYFVVSGISSIPYIDRDTCPEVFNCRKFLSSIASDCLAKYNTRNSKNLIFEKVLRANFNPISTTARYYITFTAKESPDGPEVEYQAKADWCADVTYPILCRPSPPKKAQGDGKDDFNYPN